ncbi:MAG TPA: hypothetical protein PKY29_06270 [Ferruginibacter sp.]|nr:hypothetical protein [Ferruginibacter sp.]HRN79846.1 hypothetical protein [Ferruginibacter sp.]HRO17846.1 hypothetical protein [Ferruginibacter sp.]HRQ20902.1 hypothetical protein [Ferruginibacter sp.]
MDNEYPKINYFVAGAAGAVVSATGAGAVVSAAGAGVSVAGVSVAGVSVAGASSVLASSLQETRVAAMKAIAKNFFIFFVLIKIIICY